MPKIAQYRSQSVIYFEGDKSEKIFILKAGKVSLNHTDIETGESLRNRVEGGEFFGVSSALGKYPRSEDALALSDTTLVVLTATEFEEFCMNNPKLAINMLRLFSTQLRKIHSSVRSLMHDEHLSDPESGLYRSGEFYLAHQSYGHAVHALDKYCSAYPRGRFIKNAQEYLNQALQALGESPRFDSSSIKAADSNQRETLGAQLKEELETGKVLFQKGEFKSAGKLFKRILEAGVEDLDVENTAQKLYGQCLYETEEYQDAIDIISRYVQKNSTDAKVHELLYCIGDSYFRIGNVERAKLFLQRAQTLVRDDTTFQEKVKEKLSTIGE